MIRFPMVKAPGAIPTFCVLRNHKLIPFFRLFFMEAKYIPGKMRLPIKEIPGGNELNVWKRKFFATKSLWDDLFLKIKRFRDHPRKTLP